MRHVFVDSGAFFGMFVPEDAHHQRAMEFFAHANSQDWQLVTTNVVVIETHALIVNRSHGGRANALAFLDAIEGGGCQVERVGESDETRAVALLRAHEDKTYSFCDALSFVVMERLNIPEAIAFDRHFAEYGRFALL